MTFVACASGTQLKPHTAPLTAHPLPQIRPWLAMAMGSSLFKMRCSAASGTSETSSPASFSCDAIRSLLNLRTLVGRRPFRLPEPIELSLDLRRSCLPQFRKVIANLVQVLGCELKEPLSINDVWCVNAGLQALES